MSCTCINYTIYFNTLQYTYLLYLLYFTIYFKFSKKEIEKQDKFTINRNICTNINVYNINIYV